jgi:Flp pilus assembly protein TadG
MNFNPRSQRRRQRQRGSFMIEFALVAPFLMILLAGSFTVGMGLNRSIQCSQVCRNANALMARGVDLSKSTAQQMLIRAASGMGFNQAGSSLPDPNGKGAIYLTKVVRVGDSQCYMGIPTWNGSPGTCPNYGQYVIAQRIAICNTSRWASSLGNPSSTLTASGIVTDADIANVSTNRATNFTDIITLANDEFAFVSELFADIDDLAMIPWLAAPRISMRNVS